MEFPRHSLSDAQWVEYTSGGEIYGITRCNNFRRIHVITYDNSPTDGYEVTLRLWIRLMEDLKKYLNRECIYYLCVNVNHVVYASCYI